MGPPGVPSTLSVGRNRLGGAVSYDKRLWADSTSLRFLTDAYSVLIMGPNG
jgi:hypothetical protein